MTLTLESTVQLRGGAEMPRLGLGVFRTGTDGATARAVRAALDAGYRHVDTATIYRNEEEVGAAIRSWLAETGHPRSAVFVTTKLFNDDHGFDEALRAFDASLARLGLTFVDQYLIHWPVPERRLASWKALERIRTEGRARSIGVSNFTERHLDELLATASIPPDVNQVELHPFLQQHGLVAKCRALNIQTVAYSPLTKGRQLTDRTLAAVAARVGRTPAQIAIRWSLQQGHVVLPKSSNPERIAENARVFDFALDTAALDQLASLEAGLRTAWNPTDVR